MGFFDCGGSVLKLDKLAVGIVGVLFGNDGQAAADGLDDAGHFIQIVVHCAALDGGILGRGGVGSVGGLLDGEAVMLAELLEAVAEVGKYLFGVFLGVGSLFICILIFDCYTFV